MITSKCAPTSCLNKCSFSTCFHWMLLAQCKLSQEINTKFCKVQSLNSLIFIEKKHVCVEWLNLKKNWCYFVLKQVFCRWLLYKTGICAVIADTKVAKVFNELSCLCTITQTSSGTQCYTRVTWQHWFYVSTSQVKLDRICGKMPITADTTVF